MIILNKALAPVKMASSLVFAVVTASALTTNAFGCELHAGGNFGFGFNQMHPLAQQHYQASAFKTLSVKHANQVEVMVDEASTAKISYVVPLRYRNVNVSFEGSENVEIMGEPDVLLEDDSGVYNLTFTVKQPGNSHISIKINGMKDGNPFSINQKIKLRSA